MSPKGLSGSTLAPLLVGALLAAAGIQDPLLLWTLAPLVPGFSRLAPDRLRDQPVRRAILDLVEPGRAFSLSEIVAALRCPMSSIRYHLDRLVRAGRVIAQGHKWHQRYHGAAKRAPQALRDAQSVADHILESLEVGETRFVELRQRVQARARVSNAAVWKALERLRAEGRVELERRGRQLWARLKKARG